MQDFTPLASLTGGAMIGLAASLLLVVSGRVAGISGILGGLLPGVAGDRGWRAWFIAGLLAAGAVSVVAAPASVGPPPKGLVLVAAAGLLVGIGTRLGNGCTSGHGVCGISRLSRRSLAATATFIAAGMLTVAMVRWLGGES